MYGLHTDTSSVDAQVKMATREIGIFILALTAQMGWN